MFAALPLAFLLLLFLIPVARLMLLSIEGGTPRGRVGSRRLARDPPPSHDGTDLAAENSWMSRMTIGA